MSTSHPSALSTKQSTLSPTTNAQISHSNSRPSPKRARPRVPLPFDTEDTDISTTTSLSPLFRHRTARRLAKLTAPLRNPPPRRVPRRHYRAPARQPLRSPPKRTHPLSLWQQLSDAQITLEARPRLDARFVSDTRPLDSLQDLRASIAVTLFPDGYVRHDWTVEMQGARPSSNPNHKAAASSHSHNIASLPRFPYDRYSRHFLLSLDLGYIPPSEDLPEPPNRHYYDGCLIAELRDKRFPSSQPEPLRRILLRPHMASLYNDLELLTQGMNRDAALQTEQLILLFTSRHLQLHPNLHPARCTNSIPTAYSTLDAFQAIRLPKRRRINRPPGPPVGHSLSTAALLLIAASEKQLTMHRNLTLSSRISSLENAISKPSTPSAHSSSGTTSTPTRVTSDSTPIKQEGQIMTTVPSALPPASFVSRRRHIMPPVHVLNIVRNARQGQSASQQQSASTPSPPPQPNDRIRIVRLILPDRQSAAQLQQVQAAAQAAGGGASASERAKAAKHQTLVSMNKNGKQVYILEMVKNVGRGCEIIVHRGLFGDKTRDTYRVQVNSVEEGHAYLEQFRKITKKEGYCCMHDANSANLAAAIQQHQMEQQKQTSQNQAPAQAQARLPLNAMQPIQSSSSSQRSSQAQQPQQGQKPFIVQGATPHTIVQTHAENTQNSAQQKQILLQRQQQLQQRQQQQQQQLQHQQHQQTEHMIRQQFEQQQHMQIRHQQSIDRARMQHQQMQRHPRVNLGVPQSGTVVPGNLRGAGQVGPKRMGNVGNAVAMARSGGGSAAMNSATMVMGNAAALGRGNHHMMTHAQLQQLQLHSQQQQMRVQEHQRNLLANVAGIHPAVSFGHAAANGTAGAAQQLQNRTISAVMGNAAVGNRLANANGRPGSAANLNGADALTHQHLQQHFKQQREDVEAPSRAAKR